MTRRFSRPLWHAFACVIGTMAMLCSCKASQHWADEGPSAFESTIANPEVQLLDVRHPAEFFEGHIKNARNIDVMPADGSDFVTRAGAVLNKHKPVAVYCRSGKRSALAAKPLAKAGYKVTNLNGGVIAWQVEGKSLTK